MRKTILGVAVAIGLVVGFALPVMKAKGAENHHWNNNRQYVIRTTGRSFIDLPPAGSSAGDRVAFDNPLFDRTNTKQIGSSRGECIQVGASAAIYHCLAVFSLPDGQIATQGIADFAQPSTVVAITGGTGTYKTARGQVTFTQTSETTDSITVELR